MLMNTPYPDPERLWSLPPHSFNEWKAQNDLPQLFEYLRGLLPGFGDWLDLLPFGMDVALRIIPTGDLFKGEKNKVVFRRPCDFPNTSVIELLPSYALCRV